MNADLPKEWVALKRMRDYHEEQLSYCLFRIEKELGRGFYFFEGEVLRAALEHIADDIAYFEKYNGINPGITEFYRRMILVIMMRRLALNQITQNLWRMDLHKAKGTNDGE